MTVPKEIEIKIAYGHIAGKIWNETGKNTPIIAVHGWMDNAGTWDKMCPLLDKDHPVYALDMPGHGYSSHRPRGSGIYLTDNLVTLHTVINHFNFKKIILLGHSMGGLLSFLYAGTIPELIEKVIIIDILRPIEVDPKDQPAQTAASLKELLNIEEKLVSEPPRYDYKEMVQKLIQGYGQSLDEDAAKTLLIRNSRKHDDGKYSFTYAPTLKVKTTLSMTVEQQKSFLSNITCDLLIIKSASSRIYGKKELAKDFLHLYKENSRNFELEIIEGTHHLHLVTPEPVAKIVNRFLHGFRQSDAIKTRSDEYIQNL